MAINNANNDQRENDTLDGFRLLVRHYFWPLALAVLAVNAGVFYAFGADKGWSLAGVAVPVLGTAWFYSSRDAVHGPSFKTKTKTAIFYDLFTLGCGIWAVVGFVRALDVFFS